MTLPESLNTSDPVQQDQDRVHDDNYVYNQIRNLLKKKFATPLDLNNAIRTEEVTIQFENNSQIDTDLRNVRPGTGSVTFSNGEFTINTTADGTSSQALETANIGEYAAGLPGGVGLYIQLDDNPIGFAEWGYGGNAFNDELRWHLSSDGSYRFDRVRSNTLTEIPQSKWSSDVTQETITDENDDVVGDITGLDAFDGSGNSSIDISTPFVGLFGVDFVLYGGGGFAPWVVDLTDNDRVEKAYPFVFRPRNESVLAQFNQPVFARLDNDGTATADSLVITERQFTQFGVGDQPERATQHCFNLSQTISAPSAITAIRREGPGVGTRLDLLNVNLTTDNPLHVWFLVDPDVTGNDADSNWQRPKRDFAGDLAPDSETQVEVNDSLTVDASTGVAIDGAITQGSANKNNITPESTDFRSSPFIRDRPVVVMAEPFADANDSTSQEGVVNIKEGI